MLKLYIADYISINFRAIHLWYMLIYELNDFDFALRSI